MIGTKLYVSVLCGLFCANQIAYAGEWTPKPLKIPADEQTMPTETTAALRIGFPPVMPPTAERSGYCCMTADVSPEGKTKNIKMAYCTEKKFKKPSKKAMKQWQFAPAMSGETAVTAKRQMFPVTYLLTDEYGRFLPDPNGKLSVDHSAPISIEELCRAEIVS